MTDVLIETARLVLRKPRLEDLDRCAELLGDYEVAKMLSRVTYPYDREEGRAYLQRSLLGWQDTGAAQSLSFHIDHENEMIGCCVLGELQETPKIGYWLGRPYWGAGFMSEAVGAAIDWFFQNTSHDRVTCEVMQENPASLKVAEKLGFLTVGATDCVSRSRGETVPAIKTALTRAVYLNGH